MVLLLLNISQSYLYEYEQCLFPQESENRLWALWPHLSVGMKKLSDWGFSTRETLLISLVQANKMQHHTTFHQRQYSDKMICKSRKKECLPSHNQAVVPFKVEIWCIRSVSIACQSKPCGCLWRLGYPQKMTMLSTSWENWWHTSDSWLAFLKTYGCNHT